MVHGKASIFAARNGDKQRLVRVGNRDLESLPDLRLVLDARAVWHINGERTGGTGRIRPASPNRGGSVHFPSLHRERPLAQFHLAAPAQAAAATPSVQRYSCRGKLFRQRVVATPGQIPRGAIFQVRDVPGIHA